MTDAMHKDPKLRDEIARIHKVACIAHDAGNHSQATALLDQALALAPHSSVLWSVKALFAYETDDFPSARKLAETALKMHQGNFYAWLVLGDIGLDEGDKAGALACYQAVAERKENVGVLTIIAALEYDLGNYDQAHDFVERALTKDPGWEDALEIRRMVREKLGEQ